MSNLLPHRRHDVLLYESGESMLIGIQYEIELREERIESIHFSPSFVKLHEGIMEEFS